MCRFFLCVLAISFLLTNLFAQNAPPEADETPNPFDVSRQYLKQNNYITPIFELRALEPKYMASPLWKSVYLDDG